MSHSYVEEEYPIKRGDSMISFFDYQDCVSVNGSEARSVGRSWSVRHHGRSLRDLLQLEQNGQVDHRTVEINHNMNIVSPSPPFVLRFNNLTYSVSTRKRLSKNRLQDADRIQNLQHKIILDDVSGEARDGQIFAVLGQSGSGKSTLIDGLAHRISKDSLKGTVTLNGEPLGGRMLRSISAYVMQDDLLFPMLTVQETLMYAAEFRLPRSCSREKKRGRVEVLIDQLGLRAAAGTIVGDEGHRGVSGGERRRVSIGIDIIHDPILLFLDEPTSGLDSTSAFLVVKTLQRIARTGSVVILSIHQPSYRILGLLDRLIFLAHGQTVFSGSPERLTPYFAEFGRLVPENVNITEFALDLIQELEASPAGITPLVEFFKTWRKSSNYENITEAVGDGRRRMSLKEAISASIARGKLVTDSSSSSYGEVADFANPPWVEICVLTRRSFTNMRRTPELFLMRLGTVLVTSFLLATIFWKLDKNPKGIRERFGFLAFAMSTTFYCCADALPFFLHERFVFMRETAYNAYRRSSYVLANTLVSIPSLAVLALAFAVTTFWSVGLGGGLSGFYYFFLIILASFWAANSFVTFLSGAVTNLMLSFNIVMALLAYFLLFSGFFISRGRIPVYWIWFHYISLIKYPYEGVLQNEFESGPGECFARGTQVFDGTPMASLSPHLQESFLGLLSSNTNITITPTTCVTSGVDILNEQDITQLNKWMCLLVTFCLGFLFRILFYIALLLGSKNKRH